MLAMFILNIIAKVSFITPKSSVKGELSGIPNSCPYESHHKKSTPDAS